MEVKKYLPKVSIVIPAYNASNYLAEAIDSALAQTYSNVEIIVINDGSDDNGATRKIALSYGESIQYFEKENGGSSSALNMGISKMSGEWFSWLSHDDLYMPQKIEKQIEYINLLEINVCDIPRHIFFSASELIDAQGKVIHSIREEKVCAFSKKVESFAHNGYLVAEPTVYSFHGCSCLIHKKAFADIGLFDENLRLLNDLDMWFRMYIANYKVHYIPEILVKGRVHAKQVSNSIGFSYHNPEQDMFWNRSLNWLADNYPEDKNLFFLFGKNAYLKTRNIEGDRAFGYVNTLVVKKISLKIAYKSYAFIRNCVKKIYLAIKV